MNVSISTGWEDYELLDSGNGRKLEKYGTHIVSRVETQALWKQNLPTSEWQKAYAVFEKQSDKHGNWDKKGNEYEWQMSYKQLKFWVKLTPFGHTGVFPEQSVQWDFIQEMLRTSPVISTNKMRRDPNETSPRQLSGRNDKPIKVLSLFTYTGLSTLAAAAAGAQVVHVDASGPAITWARENSKLSGFDNKPIRWIVDDALKFVEREIRRGNKYDAVIMDPPKFGRGPKGELWKFEESFPRLMEAVSQILAPNPLFVLVTAYSVPISSITLANTVNDYMKKYKGNLEYGELALEESFSKRLLPTSIFTRWFKT